MQRPSPLFPGTSCDIRRPFSLPPDASQRLAYLLSLAAHGPAANIQLVPPTDIPVSDAAVFIDAPPDALAQRVRTAAMRLVPAPTVEAQGWGGTIESPLVPWIIGGATLAAISLAIARLLSLADRLLAARNHHRLLINIGIHRRQLATLGAWMFAAPYCAVCLVSFAAGLGIVALLLLPGTAMPCAPISVTAAIIAAAGAAGTACVAFLGARDAFREPE